ncbi:MAG: fluoride efflux transporter CrcB [Bacteroidales bacterium]|jgi:CrcB protein|nr:fluoride efflux transporter CrcB [Bacteroidales bacterium]
MIKILLLIGSGSFLGGVTRYLVSKTIHETFTTSFPFGTFAVNIFGCLLLGIIYGISERASFTNTELKMFLTVGFCGGFTTFSTFAGEGFALLRDSNIIYFSLYAGLSVVLGVLAMALGIALVRVLI